MRKKKHFYQIFAEFKLITNREILSIAYRNAKIQFNNKKIYIFFFSILLPYSHKQMKNRY